MNDKTYQKRHQKTEEHWWKEFHKEAKLVGEINDLEKLLSKNFSDTNIKILFDKLQFYYGRYSEHAEYTSGRLKKVQNALTSYFKKEINKINLKKKLKLYWNNPLSSKL